jgi:hypothetical protein
LVIVSQTLSRPVIINTNRHYDYDIFNRQINIHLDIAHRHGSMTAPELRKYGFITSGRAQFNQKCEGV